MEDRNSTHTPLSPGTKVIKESDGKETWSRLLYREFIGRLMNLAVGTYFDISRAVNYLGQFNSNFSRAHWTSAKRVLKYLKDTIDYSLTSTNTVQPLHGYVVED